MTVIVGFVGQDGAVMVSDSQATETDRTKFDAPKLISDRGWLFGYSGNTAVREPLLAALHHGLGGFDTSGNRWNVRSKLCEIARKVLAGEYANYVPAPPPGQVPPALAGSLLITGQDSSGYWLMDIDYNSVGTFHPERGFHAVGSGSAAAQVARGLLDHYELEARTVMHLKLIAHRTVQTCIAVLDAGVGGAIQLWTLQGGVCQPITGEDLDDVEHGVEQWRLIEKESLDEVLGKTPPEAEQDTELPGPPPS